MNQLHDIIRTHYRLWETTERPLHYMLANSALQLWADKLQLWLAHKLQSTRYRFSRYAPDTFEALQREHAETGYVHVSSEHCENTIFRGKGGNIMLRAWHDATHLQHGKGFSYDEERALWAIVKPTIPTCLVALVEADIVGQLEYHATTGYFPSNQRAFTLAYLAHS